MTPEIATLAEELNYKAAALIDEVNSDGPNPSVGKCADEANKTVEPGI